MGDETKRNDQRILRPTDMLLKPSDGAVGRTDYEAFHPGQGHIGLPFSGGISLVCIASKVHAVIFLHVLSSTREVSCMRTEPVSVPREVP